MNLLEINRNHHTSSRTHMSLGYNNEYLYLYLYLYFSISTSVSICIPVYLSICLSVRLSVCLSVLRVYLCQIAFTDTLLLALRRSPWCKKAPSQLR